MTGAVRQPGLYAIEDDDRLADLIDLAGGATEEADLRAVNLAVRVKDQDHWTVPDDWGVARRPVESGAR